jgi:hypothetical protein
MGTRGQGTSRILAAAVAVALAGCGGTELDEVFQGRRPRRPASSSARAGTSSSPRTTASPGASCGRFPSGHLGTAIPRPGSRDSLRSVVKRDCIHSFLL